MDGASGRGRDPARASRRDAGIWIDLGPGRALGAEDRTLLSLVCGYLGQALYHAYQTDQQRETALALQRAILGPSRLPAGFAVRYEPATRPLEVGGDWYDIVELPDGRIGIMVGDCVGHDLGAATVMGQLRSACRALLLQDASASQALTAMDRFASFVPGAECATVFCGDPGSGYRCSSVLQCGASAGDRGASRRRSRAAGGGTVAAAGGQARSACGPRLRTCCRPGPRCCCTPTGW